MELLLTELAISSQPFQKSFAQYGRRITNTWLKLIWEKVGKFKITIEIALLPIDPLQENGKWFMKAAIEAGVTNP